MPLQSTFWLLLCVSSYFTVAHCAGMQWSNNACEHYLDYPIWFMSPYCTHNPNVMSNMADIISRSGYIYEEHVVTTEDKYMLSMFHLKSSKPNSTVIFLQYGYGSNAHIWVDKQSKSLAFHLNQLGYDVWIGNVRGGLYSGHETLQKSSQDFWDFNLDQVSQKDLPAMLDYVAAYCGKETPIVYVGEAIGTTFSYMYAASVPGSQERLKGIVSMAPLSCMERAPLANILSPIYPLLKGFLNMFGVKVILYPESILHLFLVNFCRSFPLVCLFGLQLAAGRDQGLLDPKDMLLMFSAIPSPYPTDVILQYIQMSVSKKVTMFDYGTIGNQYKYQMNQPPQYDFKKITIPVHLLYGLNDAFTPVKDVQTLLESLGSEQKTMTQIAPDGQADYNHVAFKYAKNLETQLYPVIDGAIEKILSGVKPGGNGGGNAGDGNTQMGGSLQEGQPGNPGSNNWNIDTTTPVSRQKQGFSHVSPV